jgi:hypothetical protein
MNTRKLLLYASIATLTAGLTITACKKDDSTTTTTTSQEDLVYGDEDARIEHVMNDAQTMADQADIAGTLNLKGGDVLGSGCAIVTKDTNTKLIIINFGKENCLCKDGRNRRGRIVVSYTGKYKDTGSVHSLSFDGYYVDDYKVEGIKTITNKGVNAQGLLYYSVGEDGTITSPDGKKIIRRTANRTRTWLKGESTVVVTDDEYSVTGNSTLKSSNGFEYTTTIEQALWIRTACNWITKGTVEINPAGYAARVLDYGNGGCDNEATLTVNGKVNNIILK